MSLLFIFVLGILGAKAQNANSREIDLGEFETVVVNRDVAFTIKTHLYAISDNKDISTVLDKNKARVRNSILLTLRSATWDNYADPKLAVISKAVQAKLNEILGKGMFTEVIYTELRILQLAVAENDTVTQVVSPTINTAAQGAAKTPFAETIPQPARQVLTATNSTTTNSTPPKLKFQDIELTNKLMIQGINAMKAIQERVKNDPVLKQLSDKQPEAENLFFPDGDPDYIQLSVTTADEWEDIPIKNPPYRQKGQGFITIRFFGDFQYDAPRTPYKPPRGCYLTDETRKVVGTDARVVVISRLADATAGARLVKIVEEECAKVGLKLSK